MLIRNCIVYMNKKIIFESNDLKLYSDFKEEYKDYFIFINVDNNSDNYIKLKVLRDPKLYQKYFFKLQNNRFKFENIYINIRRNNIIIIDNTNNEISIIYDEYSDEKLQHVEEILCGLYGMLFGNDGFSFVHASCVSKQDKGVLILGNTNNGKTSLMLKLLQNDFDFVGNSHIGIKNNIGLSIPTRIGIRAIILKSNVINPKFKCMIENTEGYNNYLKEKKQINTVEKFNIKMNEINTIFNVKSNSKTHINLIIDIHYLPNLSNEIKVIKMSPIEILEALSRNKKNSIYSSVNYIENICNNIKNNKNFLYEKDINIPGYKIFQNDINSIDIVNFINNKILYS